MSDIGVVAKNIRRVAHLDIAGMGQIIVRGKRAYAGHIAPPDGTSILDVADPKNPRILHTIKVPNQTHTHKVRVEGDIMLINNEHTQRHQTAAGKKIPEMRQKLAAELRREPTKAEIAKALNYTEKEFDLLERSAHDSYGGGGVRVYNVADPLKPKEIAFHQTAGNGVHRFDFDGRYAYLSTGMEGYKANIVVILDLKDPAKPVEVSRWWLPGQWVAGGEVAPDSWTGQRYECHHPLRFGNRLFVSYHSAGIVLLDVSDLAHPKLVSTYNYHPAIICSTHTYAPAPFALGGRNVAVVVDEQGGRSKWPDAGHIPGFMWVFDITDENKPEPISTYFMSEEDTPWKRGNLGHIARFGAHQPHERMTSSLVFVTWFRGGLRVVDIADPTKPKEVGYYIPTPGKGAPTVQSNDVFVDEQTGLIYLADRFNGLDILEYTGPAGAKAGN